MPSILPLSKTICSSRFNLAAAAFDQANFRPAGAPPNLTLNADTPKGVLGGSVAKATADWESGPASNTMVDGLGLYNDNSEGNAFENAPAPASGVLAIYMAGGLFELFIFETNNTEAAYADLLAGMVIGMNLYTSPFGLVTRQLPSTMATYPGGVDKVIATLTKVPTATDLKMGLKLVL